MNCTTGVELLKPSIDSYGAEVVVCNLFDSSRLNPGSALSEYQDFVCEIAKEQGKVGYNLFKSIFCSRAPVEILNTANLISQEFQRINSKTKVVLLGWSTVFALGAAAAHKKEYSTVSKICMAVSVTLGATALSI